MRVTEIVTREIEKDKPDKWGWVQVNEVAGSNRCVEKEVKLGTRQCEEYKGVRFGNGDCALLVDVWLHRVDEDDSGLTFEEWDPSADTDDSEAPVTTIVKSSELRPTGFDLREVIHWSRRYLLSVDNDNEFRSRCE